jgi:RNA polymerase sigma-70 factor (ECF subfamily)
LKILNYNKKFVRFQRLRRLIGEGGDRVTDFEQIYNTYFSDVYLYILRLSGKEDIAEEITSDTFFKAMRTIDSFRGDCDVRVWLCQIAKNSYYSYLKKNNRTQQADEAELEALPDIAPSVAEEYVRRDEIERIQKILHGMSEPYREVFMWRVYAELSFGQIAQIFGKSENWACVTYHRARKMIKERLEEKNEN